jgi:hypothetical protein
VKKYAFAPFFLIALAVGNIVRAAENCVRKSGGLMSNVSCQCIDNGNCTTGDFLSVLFNIGDWLFSISSIVALLALVIGGLFLLISSGNAERVDRGKRIVRGALLGLVVILLAWVLVNLIIMAFTGSSDGTIFGGRKWFSPLR